MRLRLPALAAAIATGLLMSVAPAASAQKTTVSLSGSTSVAPLATDLIVSALRRSPFRGRVKFRLLRGGSDVGITDVARGRVSIGMSSRDPKSADPDGVVFNKVAKDAVCVVSNPRNPLPNLSQAQIQDIFSGRVRSWSRVPGSKVNGTIALAVRTPASGTQDAFQNIFMGQNLRVSGAATPYRSSGLQEQAIQSNPNAIGYVSFAFTGDLHNIPFKGVQCTLRNAKAGTYGGVRNFFMVTRGKARGAVKAFIRFIRRSPVAQDITAKNYVPLR